MSDIVERAAKRLRAAETLESHERNPRLGPVKIVDAIDLRNVLDGLAAAADEITRLRDRIAHLERVVAAADVLLKAKGRHNTKLAYDNLAAVRKGEKAARAALRGEG